MHADGNLFDDAQPPSSGERFEILCRVAGTRVERVVSSARPVPGTYVQNTDEWVLLVRGAARLEVAGEAVDLVAGDHLFLPARLPHRVVSTDDATVWVAVHMQPEAAS